MVPPVPGWAGGMEQRVCSGESAGSGFEESIVAVTSLQLEQIIFKYEIIFRWAVKLI